jgi:hypothetical protein
MSQTKEKTKQQRKFLGRSLKNMLKLFKNFNQQKNLDKKE